MQVDKLKQLMSRCNYGVFLRVNQHREYYQTVEQYIADCSWAPEIDASVRAKMIETNTVVQIQFFPLKPGSSYSVWHYDLDSALEECLIVCCFVDSSSIRIFR